MKTNWPTKKLGDVCEVVGGGTPKTGVSEFWSDEVVWVTPKDLGQLETVEIFDTNKKISIRGLEKSSAKLLPKGSVVLSSRAPIGYVAIAGVELATNQGCRNFVCGEQISNKFLYYFLKFNTALLNSLGGGSTFKEVSGSKLKNIEIPLPPLEEQKRIVEILEEKLGKVKETIELRQGAIVNTEKILSAKLTEIFTEGKEKGWEEKEFEDVCKFENGDRGSNYPSKNTLVDEGVPFVNAGHISDSGLSNNVTYITEEHFKILRSGKFHTGDILFCLRGSLGKVAKVTDLERGAIASSLVIIRPLDVLSVDYLLAYLKSDLCAGYINTHKNGAAQPNLSVKSLKKFFIPLPDLKTQEKIVKELDELSASVAELRSLQETQLADLKSLERAYLHEAFSGKLL